MRFRRVTILLGALAGAVHAQSWTQITANGPSARAAHSAVLDPGSNTMIVFGGQTTTGPAPSVLNDTWRLSSADGLGSPSWGLVNIVQTFPPARQNHSAVYDPTNNRMIVWGGHTTANTCFNDLWQLTNANGSGASAWQSLAQTGAPSIRRSHAAVFDPSSQSMIIFGGLTCVAGGPQTATAEVWLLRTNVTPAAWTQISPTGAGPPAQGDASAVYDAVTNRLIVFSAGGNVYALSNANATTGTHMWSQIGASGSAPSGTVSAAATYDPARNRMSVFGGSVLGGASVQLNTSNALTDANGSSGSSDWVNITPPSGSTLPAAREEMSAVFNPNSRRMTIFGGRSSSYFGDTWVLTFASGGDTTVTTSPSGLQISVDGATVTGPQNYLFSPGSRHMLSAPSPQTAPSTRYVYNSWSDGGIQTHSPVYPGGDITYTANYTTQYLLTLTASPGAAGSVTGNPLSPAGDGYYNSPTTVLVTATPNNGFAFTNFSGALSGPTNPQNVTMSMPRSVTGNFQCAYSLSAPSASYNSSGGTGSVNVTAGAGCAWNVTGVPTWVTITAGSSGTGNGAVNYSVAQNTTTSPRSATLTIGGQPYTINQAGQGCSYSLSLPGASFNSSGGAGSVNMTAQAGCAWSVSGAPAFVTITAGASGTGNGTISYSVAANTSTSPRSAILTIGGESYTISQTGLGCSYALSATNASFGTSGGSGAVNVIAAAGCAWSVTGVPSWVNITSGASGSGNGTVTFSVAASAGVARSATLTIAGIGFTISQGSAACVFGLSPSSFSIAAAGGSSAINVGASAQDCARTATPSVTWISITSGATGTGSGMVGFTVQPNQSPNSRTGSITVDGRSVTVKQAGSAPCTFSLPQSSQSFPAGGGQGSATVSTQPGCQWSATSVLPWVTINAGSGTGPGVATFAVLPNPSQAARSGNILVAGITFSIAQAGTDAGSVTCTISTPSANMVRAEGRTELGRDLLFTCSGAAPAGGLIGDIVLRLNTTVTSRKLDQAGDATEALLFSGEPSSPQIGANAFQGHLAAYDELRWGGVPVLPSGGSSTRTFRITNVRFDASRLGVSPDLQPIAIMATLSVQTAVPVVIAGATQSIAQSIAGLQFQTSAPAPGPNPATQSLIPLTFTERFNTAYKPRIAGGQDGAPLGNVFNSESGYVNTPVLGTVIGAANTPTRLFVRFNNAPSGAQISASLASSDGRATLVSPAGGSSFVPIPISGGAGTAIWEINSSSASALDTLTFNLLVEGGGDLSNLLVTGGFAPASLSGVASFSETIPRFRDASVAQPLVNLRAMNTVQAGTRPIQFTAKESSERQTSVAGSNVTFIQQIVNDTDTSASNVVVRSNLPSTLELTACAAQGAACTTIGNEVKADVGTLAPGAIVTLTVTAQIHPDVPSGAVIEETVSATSDTLGADLDSSIASSSFVVIGGCGYGLTRVAAAVGPSGDLGRVDVITAPGCGWSAGSNVNWITLSTQQGLGPAPLRYTVADNPTAVQRTGVLNIAGIAFSVVQAAGGCSFSAGVPNTVIAAAGGTFAVSVAANVTSCAWTVAVAPDWITLPAGAAGLGSGTLPFMVALNPAASPRTGTITVSGTTIQVVQQRNNTPPPVAQFNDVSLTHPYVDHITLLRDYAITTGCTATDYCPDAITTRGQMAVFIIRALFGGDAFLYPASPFFTDVPSTHPYFAYIQKLRDLGITSGCTATQYCPDDPVTRGQMAVFLIRARLGIPAGAVFPFYSIPFFTDVGTTHPYFSFVQKMRELNITSGCTATSYCVDSATTRGQMAVFLIRAFFTP